VVDDLDFPKPRFDEHSGFIGISRACNEIDGMGVVLNPVRLYQSIRNEYPDDPEHDPDGGQIAILAIFVIAQ
jgi:hypothetical protein